MKIIWDYICHKRSAPTSFPQQHLQGLLLYQISKSHSFLIHQPRNYTYLEDCAAFYFQNTKSTSLSPYISSKHEFSFSIFCDNASWVLESEIFGYFMHLSRVLFKSYIAWAISEPFSITVTRLFCNRCNTYSDNLILHNLASLVKCSFCSLVSLTLIEVSFSIFFGM